MTLVHGFNGRHVKVSDWKSENFDGVLVFQSPRAQMFLDSTSMKPAVMPPEPSLNKWTMARRISGVAQKHSQGPSQPGLADEMLFFLACLYSFISKTRTSPH